ncbi:MAG TPA: hypothetical protein VIH35_01665 [Kiritimatiellia bacterium]
MRSLIACWAVMSICCLALGFFMGHPSVKPYTTEILILVLLTGFIISAIVGIAVFTRRAKPVEKPTTVYALVAAAVFALVILQVGRWIAASDFSAAPPPAAAAATSQP